MSDDHDPMQDIPLDAFETFMDKSIQRLDEIELSAEDLIVLLREVDGEEVLYDSYDLSDIEKVGPDESSEFFRFFMTHLIVRMIEKQGAADLITSSGIITKEPVLSGRTWEPLFGEVPRVDPFFLGLVQACIKTKVVPEEGMSEARKEPDLYGPLLTLIEAEGGPPPAPPDGIRRQLATDEVLNTLGAAVKIHIGRNRAFGEHVAEKIKAEGLVADADTVVERTNELMTQILLLSFFVLKTTGVLDRLIRGLTDSRPILQRAGPDQFQVTEAGRGISWIKG